MKSYIKKIANSNLGVLLRNSLNFKPVYIKHYQNNDPTTVSDAFLWRTDNGYKTKFKYSDILGLFYKVKNSRVEVHFYSKDNKLIKIKKITNLDFSNEFEISSQYLNNIEDYGVFYIYHFLDNQDYIDSENIVSNRCYVGYSFKNNLYSYMHGNTLARFTSMKYKNNISSDIVRISLFKNYTYTIQKYFKNFDKSELFFINPTSKVINLLIGNKNYKIEPSNAKIVNVIEPIVSLKSNCLFLRPTVFSYIGNYIDVHHS